jgi:hypothetical protein
MRSTGSIEFSQKHSPAEWRRKLGKSSSTIYSWSTGDKSPNRAARLHIHQEGGPDPSAWDVAAPMPAAPPSLPAIPCEEPTAARVESAAAELLQSIRTMQARLAADNLGDPDRQVRQVRELAQAMAQLGRMTAVGLQLSERQILASPNWAIIKEAIVESLEPWPDALLAVGERLAELEGGAQ